MTQRARNWRAWLRPAPLLCALYLLALPAYCLARVGDAQEPLRALTFGIPLLLSAFNLAHAADVHGWARALRWLAAAMLISLAMELLGAGTGFLFGHYVYADSLGPKVLGLVPWLIPFAWFMVAYPAWACVAFVWPRAPLLARAALAALAVTAYDLSLDPRMVADGHWSWPGGGAYFGIPLSNFVGWWVTGALIFIVWARESRAAPEVPWAAPGASLPVWAYVVLWLGEAGAQAAFWNGPQVALVVLAGMGIFGLPALRRLTLRAPPSA